MEPRERLTQQQAVRAALVKEIRSLESDGALSESDRTRVRSLRNEVDSHTESINKLANGLGLELRSISTYREGASTDAICSQLELPAEAARTVTSETQKATGSGIVDVQTGREVRAFRPGDSWLENREYRLPDNMRADELNMGRFVRALATGDWTGADAEARVMALSPTTAGGVLVPAPLADRIIEAMRNKLRVIAAGATTLQMDATKLTIARETGQHSAGWVAENAKGSFSDMSFTSVELTAHKLVALGKASEEVLADAGNLEAAIIDSMAYALANELDDALLNGNNTNKPYGILQDTAVTKNDLTATAIDIDHFLDAYYHLVNGNVDPARVSAMFNSDVGKALAKLKDATSGLYLGANAPDEYRQMRKIITPNIATASGSPDTTDVIFGDFASLLVGMRGDLQLEVSRSAYDEDATQSAFQRSQVFFRATMRVDGHVGQPASFYVQQNAGV